MVDNEVVLQISNASHNSHNNMCLQIIDDQIIPLTLG